MPDLDNPMVSDGPAFLNNGVVQLGVVKEWKAVIGHFSRLSDNKNVFTAERFDAGVVNQSYWGDPGGPGCSWPWDPIQGGTFNSEYGDSQLLQYESNGVDKSYAKVIPVQFNYTEGNVYPGMIMEQWVELIDKVAKIRFKVTYTGGDRSTMYPDFYQTEYASWYGKVGWNQETPAISIGQGYNHRYGYVGNNPWSGAPASYLGDLVPPYAENAFLIPNEKWIAVVNDTGYGFGVLAPDADAFSVINIGGWSPTYITPSTCFNFTDGRTTPVVLDYTVYFALGTVEEIRSAFYGVHGGLSAPPHHLAKGGSIHLAKGGSVKLK